MGVFLLLIPPHVLTVALHLDYDGTMNEASSYRHPKHELMSKLITSGLTDSSIMENLGVARCAVVRVRKMLGVPPVSKSTSKGDKLDRATIILLDGHTGWTGRRAPAGAPLIRHLGRELSAAHVAFERRTGRAPVGSVRADCDMAHCLTPEHLMDDIERRKVRVQLRSLKGYGPHWEVCPADPSHTWEEHGRVEPSLELYCRQCNSDRSRARRVAVRKEAIA